MMMFMLLVEHLMVKKTGISLDYGVLKLKPRVTQTCPPPHQPLASRWHWQRDTDGLRSQKQPRVFLVMDMAVITKFEQVHLLFRV